MTFRLRCLILKFSLICSIICVKGFRFPTDSCHSRQFQLWEKKSSNRDLFLHIIDKNTYKSWIGVALSALITFPIQLSPPISQFAVNQFQDKRGTHSSGDWLLPSSYADDVWTDRNRLAAEAWRKVDELFYDRTFNGQDWFKLRQSIVKKSYSSDSEVYTAIQSMLSKLGDKYTRYLTPAQYGALMNSATGELTGVGVQLLQRDDGTIFISNIEDNSPAASSGLRRGDILRNVDGTDTDNLSPEEVAAVIRGRKDTKASLRIQRDGAIQDIVVVRQPFKLKGVSWTKETINNNRVGIITVKSFSTTTKEDVTTALESLESDRLDSIVIDLRNNGGGVLQAAVDVATLFLPPGKIVTFVVGKDGLQDALQTLPNGITSNDPNLPDLKTKLYLLVNDQTASAAEVLTAGLKENGRSKVIGKKTFGKGIIQNLQELQQGGIAVTISRYETPLHNNINKIGIDVDVDVDCDEGGTIAACLSKVL